MIYGDPQVHIDDDHTDRIGIRTLVLSRLWQPSRWPLSLAELDGEKPDVPGTPGGVIFIGEQTRRAPGALRTTWTFEGINGDGKSVTFKDRTNSPDYSFEPGFSQVSILKHPNFAALRDKYGGQVSDGQVTWPETVPGGANSGPVVGGGQGKSNPLFGHDDFFRMEGTYSFRYASTSMTEGMSNIGRIFSTSGLPGKPPTIAKRNWLKAPTPWQRRGPVFEITEVYWLSGDGGWPPEIYRENVGGATGGLQIGGIA
jgi:hypothetical protein